MRKNGGWLFPMSASTLQLPRFDNLATALTVFTDGRFLVHRRWTLPISDEGVVCLAPLPSDIRNLHVRSVTDPSATVAAIDFEAVPSPTARVRLVTPVRGDHVLEVSYSSKGIEWRAEYNGVLAEDGSRMELDGNLVVVNRCGAAFADAQLTLCKEAGQYDKGGQARPLMADVKGQDRSVRFYPVHFPVSLPATGNEVRVVFSCSLPVNMLHKFCSVCNEEVATEINLDKGFLPESSTSVECIMKITNPEDVAMPRDFPSGPLDVVYRCAPAALGLQYFGSFRMPRTRPGEDVYINLGRSRKVHGERTRLDCRLDRKLHALIETFAIKIRNESGSDTAQTELVVEEHMLRWKCWRISSSNLEGGDELPPTSVGSHSATWNILMAPGTKTLVYTVVYTHWLFPNEQEQAPTVPNASTASLSNVSPPLLSPSPSAVEKKEELRQRSLSRGVAATSSGSLTAPTTAQPATPQVSTQHQDSAKTKLLGFFAAKSLGAEQSASKSKKESAPTTETHK